MNGILVWAVGGCCAVAAGVATTSAVHVRGHLRSNGTYVAPHYRSTPDGRFSNNWSSRGNINPYTGKLGYRTKPSAPSFAVGSLGKTSSSTSYRSPVSVQGYVRSDGAYVAPHHRSARDGISWNNWTSYGNVNPYTGELGYTLPDPGRSVTQANSLRSRSFEQCPSPAGRSAIDRRGPLPTGLRGASRYLRPSSVLSPTQPSIGAEKLGERVGGTGSTPSGTDHPRHSPKRPIVVSREGGILTFSNR